jgi:hypothetical protein
MPEFKSSFGEKNQLPRDNRPGNPATFGRVIGRALPPSETRCLPIEAVRSLDADTLNALSDHLQVCELIGSEKVVESARRLDAMVRVALGGGVR